MLTTEDIKKLIEAEKEVFPTKTDFEELRTDFRSLQTSVDAYAKQAKDYYQEVTVLMAKVNRMENWLKDTVAPKLGVHYDPHA